MKRNTLTILLAAAGMLLAGVQTAKAQKVVLHMAGNQTFECSISQLDSITFVDATDICSQMEKDTECALFYEALNEVGLGEVLGQSHKDESWDYSPYLSCERVYDLPSFSQYCHLPKTRETGFTIMACTNEALNSKYNIHDLQGFYDFALSVYGGSEDDALRKLLSYCIIDRKTTLERLTTLCSIDTLVSQPTEWYSTLLPNSTLKVTRSMNETFLNMSGDLAGVRISKPQSKNICGNGNYYLTDGLPLYNEECKSAFASERMRMDFYTLIPELENVAMRSSETGAAQASATETNAISKSYYIPSDYLQSISVNNAETDIIYENVHNESPLYEGDGIWLCGQYDVTFKLPVVPKRGTYEVRIGYTAMLNSGICQIYFGSDPQRLPAAGIPMNFYNDAIDNHLPWIPLTDDPYTDEQRSESRRSMRNCGFMHGPASMHGLASFFSAELEDEIIYIDKLFCDNPSTLRSIIVRQTLDENTQYYLRFKSVIDSDKPICLDYIELVNKDVYDNPEKPEDIY